ncbi:MAG: hypothetical protein RML15_05575 [Bacteroidota bacterium]|nr:hypothetical protein [Candidatus Kapabacteria bacterium]MCS7302853.1 hypothetical protein [Candidatus Kapabacteria bacterium]MCX7937170.1 hypothetical protein [Chlorobiota bacterium]MDW8075247.1 hypothetical protein [Bacteroidota bacterium]MDW8271860.1 hypothetical protein [Bacteroidota bacterium]
MDADIFVYSPENLFRQIETAPFELGYYTVRFYVDQHGRLARKPTDRIATFYYSPSGGTLRDENLNIVLYSARLDRYKGYGRLSDATDE